LTNPAASFTTWRFFLLEAACGTTDIHTMKDSEATLVKRLETIADIEDKYFPGYLGNPTSLGIILSSMRRKLAARRRP
jgi:hypothetical protein